MRRAITVGLSAAGDAWEGWRRVLRQEKIPWETADGPIHPIGIFDRRLPEWFEEFVRQGGVALVTGAPANDALFGPSCTVSVTRFRAPSRDREALMPCLARLFAGAGEGEIRQHENRKLRSGRLADVRAAVLSRPVNRGWVIYPGLPLAEHLSAAGDCLRTFTDSSNLTERVSSTDKAEIVDTMVSMLRQAFDKASLPYVRLARFPGAAKSVFMFRVDVDGLFGSQCRDIAELARAHGVRASFYFNAALCRAYPGDLSADWLQAHEIGHHADVHDLFDTVSENRANLLSGIAWVEQQLGIRTSSYVAPRGLWNRALDTAMAELGHVYSSDFGLDFDSMPFFTPAGVLQIPVHPFSPERLAIHQEDSGFGPPSARAVLDHYLSAMERQAALGHPVHLYGHPEVLGRMAAKVLPDMFRAIGRLGIPNMTLADYAAWWIERDRTALALSVDDDTDTIEIESNGEAVEIFTSKPIRVTLNGDMHALDSEGWTTVLRGERIHA
jgi:peptidoglycan/xylan/chitin deacetylase (PgdA/CDA1 family)